jgi:hypothetical protein
MHTYPAVNNTGSRKTVLNEILVFQSLGRPITTLNSKAMAKWTKRSS